MNIVNRFHSSFRRLAYVSQQIYAKNPFLANCTTGFVTFAGGDLIAQYLEKCEFSLKHIDYKRVIATGGLGVCLNGFVLLNWYRYLDRVFGSNMASMKSVVLKCISDQIIYAPFSICVFFGYAAGRKSNSIEEFMDHFLDKVEDSLLKVWFADCCVWPTVNFIGFRFMSLNFRPTFISVVQLFWQIYLSSVSFTNPTHHHHFGTSSTHPASTSTHQVPSPIQPIDVNVLGSTQNETMLVNVKGSSMILPTGEEKSV